MGNVAEAPDEEAKAEAAEAPKKEAAAEATGAPKGEMEAEAAEISGGSERRPIARRPNPLGCVLDHGEPLVARQPIDLRHIRTDPSIMDRSDGSGLVGDRLSDARRIQIQRIRPNIHENRDRASENEGIGRRHKRV